MKNEEIVLKLTKDQFSRISLALDNIIDYMEEEEKSKKSVDAWKKLKHDIWQQKDVKDFINK